MAFEIQERDLLARIGRLKTKSGTVETPLLLPVINPAVQPISPQTMGETLGCEALITNAYIIKKHYKEKALRTGIHRLLNFNGVVVTDSGAYQLLTYGDVDVTPSEIVQYQEGIDTDVATILDVPTGWKAPKNYAQYTVDETLRRAKELARVKSRDDILWVGPTQGGRHLDLVARSARAMGKLPFQIHALGSPTQVMEQYVFDILVDMIATAKMSLPPERPLHLFGAGHPFMFTLAVALGCDLFDSAAYAIYAREDRYLTTHGTLRLRGLKYLPCPCPVCEKIDPRDLTEMPKGERTKILAFHNLYVSLSEIRRIKQAIVEGRLWEHLELRAHGHPTLLQALKNLRKYQTYLEKNSPITKNSGLFFFGSLGLIRPEVVRHKRRLSEGYSPPKGAEVLLLLPQTPMKPFHKSREHQRIMMGLQEKLGDGMEVIHVCTYAAPFGIVPQELDEAYPLSQYEITFPLEKENIAYTAKQVAIYVAAGGYRKVVLLQDAEVWGGKIAAACRKACKKGGVHLKVVGDHEPWTKDTLDSLLATLQEALSPE